MKWSRYNIYVPVNGPRKLFVFNTLARSIASLNLEQDFDPKKPPEEYGQHEALEKLEQLGMIVDDDIDEKLLFKYLFNRWRYDKTILGLFISFTSICNFACKYCYESYKDKVGNQILTERTWERLFRFIEKRISTDSLKSLNVVFFGGEPLVNHSVVMKAARDLRGLSSLGLNVRMTLITNGSLLSKSKAEELTDYIDSVQLTLDGIPSDHNVRRPYKDGRGSFEDVFKHLTVSAEIFREVSLRIGVDEGNVKRIPELLSYLKDNGLVEGLGAIGFAWILPTQAELESAYHSVQHLSLSVDKVNTLLALQKRAVALGFKVSKDFIDGPCVLVSPNTFIVDETLKVYKCPGFLYQKPVGYIDELGDLKIEDNFWYEAITLEPGCVYDCIYGPICFGGCRWQAGDLGNTSCKKGVHDKLLMERIKIYADSISRARSS